MDLGKVAVINLGDYIGINASSAKWRDATDPNTFYTITDVSYATQDDTASNKYIVEIAMTYNATSSFQIDRIELYDANNNLIGRTTLSTPITINSGWNTIILSIEIAYI